MIVHDIASDFNKLLHVTGYILKFKSLVQRTQASQKGEYRLVHKDQLTGDDINAAEILWIRSIQADLFSAELTYLRSKLKETPPSLITQFGYLLMI